MTVEQVNRVRGVADQLPAPFARTQRVQEVLLRTFDRFGYRQMATPLLEHTDLYLRKSGEEIVTRLYDFHYKHQRLSLRPELTASVVRAYIDQMQDEMPLPARLSSAGSVFRYEKPQPGFSRQFTQVGIELIGVPGVLGDVEVVRAACGGLDALGVQDYRVVLGNVGVLTHFLRTLGIEGQMYSFLLHNLETLRTQGIDHLVAEIMAIQPEFVFDPHAMGDDADDSTDTRRLIDILKHMSEDDARTAVYDFLQSLNITIDSNREKNDIVDGLLAKIRRENQLPRLNRALAFMLALVDLVGSPDATLTDAAQLLAAYGMDTEVLDSLRQTVELLRAAGVDDAKITVDFGLSRGLQYYTGMVFEIHHDSLGHGTQICGGGRYDDLVATLGGRDTAAIGFSYWLERVAAVVEAEQGDMPPQTGYHMDAVVIPASAEQYGYALQVAEQLRGDDRIVSLAVMETTADYAVYAEQRGIRCLVIIGDAEQQTLTAQVHDRERGESVTLPVNKIAAYIAAGGSSNV